MAASIVSQKSVCVVTGCTRGLGRAITLQFAKRLPKESLIILLSRNESLINEVADLVRKENGIRVTQAVFDQGKTDSADVGTLLAKCMSNANVSPSDFNQAILVNNAASLDTLEYAHNLHDGSAISNYFQINLTGCMVLTAKFLQLFSPTVIKSRVVINISSLAAIVPMKSWSLYCMAKAARDMMMKVLASEEGDTVRTLNYAPGPLPTDMVKTASVDTKDDDLRKWFQEQLANNTLVNVDDSASKLMTILDKNTFESGGHVDYYDEI